VPWGKHTHAKYREELLTEKARSIREETGLPVITVRHHVPSTPVLCQKIKHQICECAGGKVRTDQPFQYIVESAKDGPGHGSVRTGMVAAWIKYGKPLGIRAGFSKEDYEAAKEFLNSELMETFYYKHPRAN